MKHGFGIRFYLCKSVFIRGFSTESPRAYITATGYPGAIYDAAGRFIYVSLTKKF